MEVKDSELAGLAFSEVNTESETIVSSVVISNTKIDQLTINQESYLSGVTVTKSDVYLGFPSGSVDSMTFVMSPSSRIGSKCGSRLGLCTNAGCTPMFPETFDNVEIRNGFGNEIDLRGVCDLPTDWDGQDLTGFRICATAQQTWTGNLR